MPRYDGGNIISKISFMKVFISWSGTSSRMVAEALSDWLQRAIQAVKPFYSPDIDKGAKWSNEIDNALEGTRFGIVCLTPDNLKSEWIHYESGALSKTKDASIWTFLLSLKPSDVKQPLGRFQHTLAEKAEVLKMLKSINAKLTEVGSESLKDNLLEEIFEETWSKLELRLNEAKKAIEIQINKSELSNENIRTDDDKLDEILELLRNQQRKSSSFGIATSNIVARFPLKIVEGVAYDGTFLRNLGHYFDAPTISLKDGETSDTVIIEIKLLGNLPRKIFIKRLKTAQAVLNFNVDYFDWVAPNEFSRTHLSPEPKLTL